MKQSFVFAGAAALVGFALFACDSAKEEKPVPKIRISAEVLTTHNSESSCWIAVDDVIYDITSYLGQHPSGKAVILPFCGSNATEKMDEHSQAAKTELAKLPIKGTISGEIAAKTYTAAEVANHKTADDCWMTIGLRVYNVSGYFATTRPANNNPFVHQGGLLPNATPVPNSENKNASRRAAIVTALCGKDVSYYFGESTTLTDPVGTYSFQVAQGETCPTYAGANSTGTAVALTQGTTYKTSGTCSSSGGTCTTAPCVFQEYGGSGTVTIVAEGGTCLSYTTTTLSSSNNYKTSGTCTYVSGNSTNTVDKCSSSAVTCSCSSGPCVFQVPAGGYKQHSGASQRTFFEKYYIGTIQQ